jgi:hypothetical protein
VQHDFLTDPIKLEQGPEAGWLKAAGTTLGADNGIGAAAGEAITPSSQEAYIQPLQSLCRTALLFASTRSQKCAHELCDNQDSTFFWQA